MIVLDAQAWGLLWPWLLVWFGTLALVVAVPVLIATRPRAATRRAARGISLYLDDGEVMDLYQLHGYALEQQIDEKIHRNTDTGVSAEGLGLGASHKTVVDRETFRRYISVAEPIAVIGMIMDVLDGADDIVRVDLRTGAVEGNAALRRVLDQDRPRHARMADLVDTFVAIRARYRRDPDTSDDAPAFLAERDDARIRVSCVAAGLRTNHLPERPFVGECLGRVEDWDAETGELTLHPIAFFR